MELFPEIFVVVDKEDARSLGIQDGESVRLLYRSNSEGIVGKIQPSKLVRKGCVAVSFHYGHSQLGASRLPISKGGIAFLDGKKSR